MIPTYKEDCSIVDAEVSLHIAIIDLFHAIPADGLVDLTEVTCAVTAQSSNHSPIQDPARTTLYPSCKSTTPTIHVLHLL